jgi:lysophospholipase L1-like esterase
MPNRWRASFGAVSVALLLLLTTRVEAERATWVATWGASPQDAAEDAERVRNATIRQFVRISLGGSKVRIRLSNAYGTEPVLIRSTHLALRGARNRIVPGTDRAVTFRGLGAVTIPAGGVALSDAVDLALPDLADVAISLYLPGDVAIRTEHTFAMATSLVSPPGDFSARTDFTPARTTDRVLLATDLEVAARGGSRAVVVLGDSVADGIGSTMDAHQRWPDHLARRLLADRRLPRTAVINQGIAGNRILHDWIGTRALARMDRDVLARPGVRYVIVFIGLNDFGIPAAFDRPAEEVSADDVIEGLQQIIARTRAAGLKVYGGTLKPMEGSRRRGYYSPASEAKRQAVNRWIRTSRAFDAVIDFDAVVRDPERPARLLPAYDSGDGSHPNDRGYKAIADAIDLALFRP